MSVAEIGLLAGTLGICSNFYHTHDYNVLGYAHHFSRLEFHRNLDELHGERSHDSHMTVT